MSSYAIISYARFRVYTSSGRNGHDHDDDDDDSDYDDDDDEGHGGGDDDDDDDDGGDDDGTHVLYDDHDRGDDYWYSEGIQGAILVIKIMDL